MSDPTPFSIHDFDAALLDAPALVQGITTGVAPDGWTLHALNSRLYQAVPMDSTTFPTLAIQDIADATRQFKILEALYNLGVSMAPRPFYADRTWLVCEWLHGEPLQRPPAIDDEDRWHRIMALLGTPAHLTFAQHASAIAMIGNGVQNPSDLIQRLDDALACLEPTDARLADLSALVERVHQQVAPTWNQMPMITLNHLDPLPHHFIWDGKHMRLVGWDKADWSDAAYGVGQLCAHPVYEDVPASHWVWYRWELGRLTHDDGLSARATTYTNLMLVYWAIMAPNPKQRERYYRRAQRAFT